MISINRLSQIILFLLFGLVISLFSTASSAKEIKTILALGDSLTAGYGLSKAEGFTNQLQAKLRETHPEIKVINGGVSGDTSKGGLSRLNWLLASKPDMIILELGANDGLRALSPADTRANLDAMIKTIKSKNIPILFAGMLAPPNMGKDYGKAFNSIYPDLAKTHDIPFYPFFLEGVAGEVSLNQFDGMHPNAEGVKEIVKRITPHILNVIGS